MLHKLLQTLAHIDNTGVDCIQETLQTKRANGGKLIILKTFAQKQKGGHQQIRCYLDDLSHLCDDVDHFMADMLGHFLWAIKYHLKDLGGMREDLLVILAGYGLTYESCQLEMQEVTFCEVLYDWKEVF